MVTDIQYSVDVNTGEHIKTDSLSKNGIALCEIVLAEAISTDLFSKHKTLGELILIDRVSNMTSGCGVVEKLEEKQETHSDKASFVLNDIKARGDVFEEFYYDTLSYNVFKYQPSDKTYTVGDEIITKGKSYEYPDSFDILVLRDNTAVKIRNKKITDILPLHDYRYDSVPLVNGRGFAINIGSSKDLSVFLENYRQLTPAKENEFFSEWFRFNTYRKVVFGK